MADMSPDRVLLSEVQEGAEVIALLAGNEEAFRAVVDAFRAQDGESMQKLLARHGLGERCEVVCHWLRSKECVLLCLELAGPPPLEEEPPDVREFAAVVAKVTADEELVELIAAAIEQRDGASWAGIVKQNGLERFAHLLCHWACTVHYRLICDVVCRPLVKRPHLIPELQAAGHAIGTLAADEKTFAAAVEAVRANDCRRLATTLDAVGLRRGCHLICEWFCSERCMLVCLRLCRVFPIERPESAIDEMLEFARAGGKLAAEKGQLERLTAAVLREDVETVQSLVKEFAFERYCIQFCHWVCFLRCLHFCTCVCPLRPCAITAPTGCTGEQADPVAGLLFVPIDGTADGSGSYTLTIQADGDPPIPGVISYPGGGASGTAPVINGELGRIDTTSLSDSAYTLTLTVHSGAPGSPVICTKTISFNLLKIGVYISQVDSVQAAPSWFEETAELSSGGQVQSFGGDLGLLGSAYVYGCATQKIANYELRYARVAAPAPPGSPEPLVQPATNAAVPAAWPTANRLHAPLVYDATKYYPCTRVGEAPTNLINDWGTMHVGAPPPGGTDYPILLPGSWQSRAATAPFPPGTGGGRFNLLLIVEDTLNNTYYDLQRIWIDNWSVVCDIVKFQRPGATPGTWEDIPPCTDILISWGKLRIIGLAWDHLIDDSWAPIAPNDNFANYGLSFHKQFVGAESIPITPTPDHPGLAPTVRVPNTLAIVPTTADAALLAEWDLTALDAGVRAPGGVCSAPLPVRTPPLSPNALYRGCSCTYDLSLGVNDTTISDELGVHHPSVTQPIKVVNDLP